MITHKVSFYLNLVEKDIFQSVEQSVARLNNEVQSYQGDAKQLAINLKTISVMAESISSRVSALDQARSRLVKCLQRINDLKDLRTCAEGVEIAMKQEEYDEAARHVQKFFALDSILFKNAEQIDTKGYCHCFFNPINFENSFLNFLKLNIK